MLFKEVDGDGNGVIDESEFRELVAVKMGVVGSEEELAYLL